MGIVTDTHFQLRVYAEDTDHYGIVYHANHLKFLERARTEWLREQGYQQDKMIASGTLLIITELSIKYRYPARFDDLLTIATQVGKRTYTRLILAQTIMNEKNQLIASAQIRIACVNQQFNLCRLPKFQ